MSGSGSPTRYEIRVEGVLDSRWAAWFEGLQVTSEGSQTVICGLVADQPASATAAQRRAAGRDGVRSR